MSTGQGCAKRTAGGGRRALTRAERRGWLPYPEEHDTKVGLQSYLRPRPRSRFGSGPSWKSARGEPIACTASHGQPSYRPAPAPVRPVRHDAGRSVQSSWVSERRVRDYPGRWSAANGRCCAQTAHTIRASLFATATAATLRPRRCSVCTAHCCSDVGRAAVFACQTTERAPCVRSMRTYTSPCLLMAPSRRRDPLESSFGVRPRKLAKCRPDGKRRMSVTSATSAVAVISPTPGTVCKSVTSRHLGRERLELSFDGTHVRLEHLNLVTGRRERRVQQQRHRGRFDQQRPDVGDDVLRADGDKDAEFAQQASERY